METLSEMMSALLSVEILCRYPRALQSGCCNRAVLLDVVFENKEAGWLNVNYLLAVRVLVVDCSFEGRQICSKLKSIQYGTLRHVCKKISISITRVQNKV